jgi:hypothetical protein
MLKLLSDLVALSIDHDVHRASIAPLKQFFSQASIYRVEPRIQACVLKLTQKLEELASANADPKSPVIVNLTHAFNSYANGKRLSFEERHISKHGLRVMVHFIKMLSHPFSSKTQVTF